VGKNSGLGLSISREIVQAYGGRIWAGNRSVAAGAETFTLDEQVELRERRVEGVVGARFTVRLPATDATPSRGAPLARRG
jgi:two-component system sensor histidine kinase ChvG